MASNAETGGSMESQQACEFFACTATTMLGITVMIVLYYKTVTTNLRTEITQLRLSEQSAIDAMREERTLRMDAEAALAGTRARSRAEVQAAYAWQFGAPSPEERASAPSAAQYMTGGALFWRKPVGEA